MNTISTWIYLDQAGEESNYPQVGSDSSNTEFQNIYWRCVCVFFHTSKLHNKESRHLLFTNKSLSDFPYIDDFSVGKFLKNLGVEIVEINASFMPPKNYYEGWRNQFYIFDIIHYLAKESDPKDKHIILDSDCVWTDSCQPIWEQLNQDAWPTYVYDYEPDKKINGITRLEMQLIYERLSGRKPEKPPCYDGGEILAATGKILSEIFHIFEELWPVLLANHQNGQLKFNEEAHVLSYIHFHLQLTGQRKLNPFIKRMWTQKHNYRNIIDGDEHLPIWHLPAEKRTGLRDLFDEITYKKSRFHRINKEKQKVFLSEVFGISRKRINGFVIKKILKMLIQRVKKKLSPVLKMPK